MKLAFVTDEHHPFQDDHARSVALKIVQDFDPDMVVCGSDGIDFYQVSHFDKNPERIKLGLQAEIDSWKKGMKEWKEAAPHAEFKYIIGNHEDRLRKYLWRHPELFGLDALRIENLLDLKASGSSGTRKRPSSGSRLTRSLSCATAMSPASGRAGPAKAELEKEKFAISVLTGHVHRGGLVTVRTRNGLVHAQEGYCLCESGTRVHE